MESAPDPDRQLVLECQDPDSDHFESAFEQIYQRYRDRVYSIAHRVTGSSNDAMDIAQEVFSLLFRKIGLFRFDSLFSTWLFRLVVNSSIDFLRSRKNQPLRVGVQPPDTEGFDLEDEKAVDPRAVAEQHELVGHVQSSILRLSPKLRVILVLRYLEGLSYEDLATTLRLSIGTVKSRLARAHLALEKLLRGTLERFGYPEPGKAPSTEEVA
jgi:RNA polymerase sigma-70 factor (ECF subfamily)